VFKVFASANKLQLTGLGDSSEAYLSQHLVKILSVCSIWKVGHILGRSELGTKFKYLLLSERKAVLEGDGFDGLPKELALAVVADEELNAR
jgi:hypothetical protein